LIRKSFTATEGPRKVRQIAQKERSLDIRGENFAGREKDLASFSGREERKSDRTSRLGKHGKKLGNQGRNIPPRGENGVELGNQKRLEKGGQGKSTPLEEGGETGRTGRVGGYSIPLRRGQKEPNTEARHGEKRFSKKRQPERSIPTTRGDQMKGPVLPNEVGRPGGKGKGHVG